MYKTCCGHGKNRSKYGGPQPNLETSLPCGGPCGAPGEYRPCAGLQPCPTGVPTSTPYSCFPCTGKIKEELPPFPDNGLLGMMPLQTACKREVAEHLKRFQEELNKYNKPKFKLKMRDLTKDELMIGTQFVPRTLSEELNVLEEEIDEVKHELAVASIRRKYGIHEPSCPCDQPLQ